MCKMYVNEQKYKISKNIFINDRKILTNQKHPSSALTGDEKLTFVITAVSWISGKDIMDTCFILNFGYEAPLPWPQVNVSLCFLYKFHL